MSKNYAKELTKEALIEAGIKEITADCKVIFDNGHILEKEEDFGRLKQGYLIFSIYALDENGNKIKKPLKRKFKGCKNLINTYCYKTVVIGLHRAMWAWFNGSVPNGFVVDHIDNKHTTLYDNRLENLQLLTPAENLAKEKKERSIRLEKCNMSKPLSYYEEKLNYYLSLYQKEKDLNSSNTAEAHTLRSNIGIYRAKIRYWKAHEEEHHPLVKDKALKTKAKELAKAEHKKRLQEIKFLKEIVDEANALYKKERSLKNKYTWKLAIKNYNDYLKNHPFKKQKNLETELFADLSSN